MSHHSVHANRMRLFLINLLSASLQQIVFFDSTVKIILSTEPQPNMSSQHAPWEEDRKCGENMKSRTIQEGWALRKTVGKIHILYTGLLSAPCLLLKRVQPFLFSATPSSYFSSQSIQAQWFVLEMLSFVSLAFISVWCLSCFTAFLSRRQSQHLTLGVLFNTPLWLDEAKETLINKPTQVPGWPRKCPLPPSEAWKRDEVNGASVLNAGLVNKPKQGGGRGQSACVSVWSSLHHHQSCYKQWHWSCD